MIKKNKKSKITIDQLGVLMKTGFSGVNKKIGHLEKFIEEQIDKLAISTAKGFESVDKRFNEVDIKIDTKVEEVKNRIDGLEKRIDDYAFNKVGYDSFNPLVKRVDALEKV